MDDLFTIEEKKDENIVKIKVVGVGGGGGNMVNYMIKEGISGVELYAANTDLQALNANMASAKLQLGEKLTRGLGAGMKPDIGREAAEESFEEIKAKLSGADLVFIATGLGGGTGTGASSVVAKAAKEAGALTVAVCTKPFSFEGPKRARLAERGYQELREASDSIVVIPNDKLLQVVEKNMGIKESFSKVDDILARAVNGISSIVLPNGADGINTDFADLQTVMSHRGLALMGVGHGDGENSAFDALKTAIESPLLDDATINGAMGVLVHFQINPDYPLTSINDAMNIVYDAADDEADVIFGTTYDESLSGHQVKVTIIATGFEKTAANNAPAEAANTSAKAAEETAQQVERNVKSMSQALKVAGGYDYSDNEDYLDIPTFLRRQMD